MKGLRFATFAKEHLSAVLEIEKLSNGAPWSEKSFENELDHEQGTFLVAIAEGHVVGYAGMWLIIDEAHIINVAVLPDYRRKGIARKLIVELLLRAKEKGAVCSTLEVRAGNEPAIKLYEAFGYVTVGRRKAYYHDNKEDALVMWLHGLDAWEPGT
jgi:ribosomal-protein-alanine N-acetyltransferase